MLEGKKRHPFPAELLIVLVETFCMWEMDTACKLSKKENLHVSIYKLQLYDCNSSEMINSKKKDFGQWQNRSKRFWWNTNKCISS